MMGRGAAWTKKILVMDRCADLVQRLHGIIQTMCLCHSAEPGGAWLRPAAIQARGTEVARSPYRQRRLKFIDHSGLRGELRNLSSPACRDTALSKSHSRAPGNMPFMQFGRQSSFSPVLGYAWLAFPRLCGGTR
jgi:hypothetical protein